MSIDKRQLETESLTKGLYHLTIAKEHFDDFRRSTEMDSKRRTGLWVGKLDFLQSDVYSVITPKSRELYHEELKSGDVLFGPAIADKWIRMNQEQRDTLEMAADGILSGEFIIEHIDKK